MITVTDGAEKSMGGSDLDDAPPIQKHGSNRPSANFSFQRATSISQLEKSEISKPIILNTVVRIFTTSAAKSYLLPWNVARQRDSGGTGFIVSLEKRIIMTNAHVVTNHNFIQVSKQNEARKYECTVLCIAHDVDLALLTLSDDNFWNSSLDQVKFGTKLPELYSEVKAVGFPTGGSTICVTKGVVSRIDAQLYVHPRLCGIVPSATHNSGPIIIIQIDAAINPGNSGGPCFDQKSICCGIASSGQPSAQNVGYIIPSKIATNFLHSYYTTGGWPGVCEAGIQYRILENTALRSFFKLKDEMTGVQVRSVAPMSALHGRIKKGDVLLKCDDKVISNEGTVAVDVNNQQVLLNLVSLITQKRIDEETTLEILSRDTGQVETISAVCKPIPALMPRYDDIDTEPTYLIVGGLVFTPITTPLKCEFFEKQKDCGIYVPKESLVPALYAWKEREDQQIVCLLRGLKHKVNAGYDLNNMRVLQKFNSVDIDNLQQLKDAVEAAKEDPENKPFLCFCFSAVDDECSGTGEDPDIVLCTKDCLEADQEIMKQHKIPSLSSINIMTSAQRAEIEKK